MANEANQSDVAYGTPNIKEKRTKPPKDKQFPGNKMPQTNTYVKQGKGAAKMAKKEVKMKEVKKLVKKSEVKDKKDDKKMMKGCGMKGKK